MEPSTVPNPSRLRVQDLVLTLFGLHANDVPIPVSTLVCLLGAAGVEAGAARSTISRLKSKGVLLREPGTTPSYRVAPEHSDFIAGDRRVFAPVRARPDDTWTLIVFSVPEAERHRRYRLRSLLAGSGFGFVASGVAIAPSTATDTAKERLATHGLEPYVEFFTALPDGLAAKVSQWWDLEALHEHYTEFLQVHRPMRTRWKRRTRRLGTATDADQVSRGAFGDHLRLLTAWRAFPYTDPNLPLKFLPKGWLAPEAKQLFWDLDALLSKPAAQFASVALHACDEVES